MSVSPPNETSRALIRGLNLLEQFTIDRPVLTLAELADSMGLSAPATHRYAITCLDLGYLEQDPLRRYRLTRRAAEPGKALLGSLPVTRHARPILRELRRQTGRTVSLAILEDSDVLYLQRLCGFQRGQYQLERGLGAGSRRPAAQTAAGKALLLQASVSALTEKAPPLELQDLISAEKLPTPRARALAIAIHVHGGRTSAIEVTAPLKALSTAELIAELGQPLLAAARLLQEALIDERPDRDGTAPAP